mgnify:CR=1 FL=1
MTFSHPCKPCTFSAGCLINVLNNEKTYDFSKDNIKIVDLLKWFDDLGISIVDIKMKYSEILEKIQCLTEDDIKRVSGIEIGGRDDVNK